MGSEGAGGLAAVAWLVAVALAAAVGAAIIALASHRRAQQAQLQLRRMESALAEFCGALRARLSAERSRCKPSESPEPPAPD